MAAGGKSCVRVPLINIERESFGSIDHQHAGMNGENMTSVGGAISTHTGCRRCQVMPFHCNHCQQRCHKKCPGHTRRRQHERCNSARVGNSCSSCHRIHAGDEHWTKVLQANDVSGQLIVCPYHGKSLALHRDDDRLSSVNSSARVPSSRDPDSRRRSSGLSVCNSSSPTSSPKSSEHSTPMTSTVLHSLFDRFCQWLTDTRRDSSSLLLRLPLSKSRSRRSSRDTRSPDRRRSRCGRARCDRSSRRTSCTSSSSSSVAADDVEERNWTAWSSQCTSTCSSLTGTSTSTACSDYAAAAGSSKVDVEVGHVTSLRSSDVTVGCDGESVVVDGSDDGDQPLCSTWPAANDDNSSGVQPDLRDLDTDSVHLQSELHGDVLQRHVLDDQQLRDSLNDWNIPYCDLQFKACIKSGIRCNVYSARWHGDVLVHTYCNLTDAEVLEFLHDVANLSRIRHENICLFMGACLQSPTQAIVTSELKGTSVYERLHVAPDKMPLRSRVSIARQVAQAVGYLHAKGIPARCLSSRNIYLDPKVKLSVLDHGIVDTANARANSLSLPRGAICYLAPEILRGLRPVVCRTMSAVFCFNTHTDVFAFGTLLYELVSGEFPWKGLQVEEVVWLVTNGQRQSLVNLGCNSVLKVLIERCWTHLAEDRPHFAEINQELQNKTGLHKRHSTSQPARLDRYGSGTSRTFCIK